MRYSTWHLVKGANSSLRSPARTLCTPNLLRRYAKASPKSIRKRRYFSGMICSEIGPSWIWGGLLYQMEIMSLSHAFGHTLETQKSSIRQSDPRASTTYASNSDQSGRHHALEEPTRHLRPWLTSKRGSTITSYGWIESALTQSAKDTCKASYWPVGLASAMNQYSVSFSRCRFHQSSFA